jgi:acetyl esterase/lipase
MLLVHGLADRMVRPQNSRELARRLRAAGVAVQLELVDGHGHATALEGWVRTRRARDPLLDTVERFVTGEPGSCVEGVRAREDVADREGVLDPA